MIVRRVETDPGYEVVVGRDMLGRAAEVLPPAATSGRIVVISDENVAPLYLPPLRAALRGACSDVTEVVLPAGEEQKTLARAEELYGVLYERRTTRHDTVVALGGGVIGDLAGFVAATYLRGVRLVQVPTTLLAQVDASVGGKVAVDFRSGKNHVGTFYQPLAVLADIDTLRTLPAEERRNGAAEVVKYALLMGEEMLTPVEAALGGPEPAGAHDPVGLCDEQIVAACVGYKASTVAADEREERGERQLLNLGHTIGHAIEAAGGFRHHSHGEAVGLGLAAALWLSQRCTGLGPDDAARGERLLASAGAPGRLDDVDADLVVEMVSRDKKASGGEVPFVLLAALGRPVRGVHVAPELLVEVVAWLRER